ncbi:transcription factor with AP2 domain(s) [Plasmodium gonderi]|uniref:Transcription factor with AP2 domain(S) n=1 Tax=Plasmodium gonderi TaxID=77519 RepID=A0A1Y1JM12_PLAGO|nr:transcription factor with AP2 domain(s) [Plasmodium gonderi]GAW83260.1 transcription factor with AP2 domain(s) [Plasmodium gonderi]
MTCSYYFHAKGITHIFSGNTLISINRTSLRTELNQLNCRACESISWYRIKQTFGSQHENEKNKKIVSYYYQFPSSTFVNSNQKGFKNIAEQYGINILKINGTTDINLNEKNTFCNKRFFSGRSGGLKRRKKRKDERVINTCSGKRLEFFYPKKKRRQRIGLIQNSRKNIVYDNILKRFLVYYYKQGIQVFRTFSCKKKKNFESARNKAIILSKQYNIKYKKQIDRQNKSNKVPLNITDSSNLSAKYDHNITKNVKIVPDKNKSGYRGVFYDSSHHAYICTYNESGIRKFQIFKIQNNDYLEAYNLAVMCRRYKLFKNFQFVSQRNRIRSGRIHLK